MNCDTNWSRDNNKNSSKMFNSLVKKAQGIIMYKAAKE